MGLDIAFDRAAALAAGLQTSRARNGTDIDIAEAKAAEDDPAYIEYLEREEEHIHVPYTGKHVTNDGVDPHIVVRANKWGQVYGPLTTWLKANNIEWSEF